jgi:DNA-nicking Smr family endonuclease
MAEDKDDVVHIAIDGTLDLHTFDPRDLPDLLEEYIKECLENGIYQVRIIHGKGKGILRDRVHSILKRHPMVMDFGPDPGSSGWGASIIRLKKSNHRHSGED